MGIEPSAPELRARALDGARRAHEALERDARELSGFAREGSELAEAAAEAVGQFITELERGRPAASTVDRESP